jgi:hypothetical protein
VQVIGQRVALQFGGDTGQAEQGLGLGRKGQPLAIVHHVQGLDPEPVAADQEPAPA